MKNISELTSLLPLWLILNAVIVVHSSSTLAASEGDVSDAVTQIREEVVVTGQKSSADITAGAGFKTSNIDVGPLGNRAWIDTPYSSTTVSRQMIANQQAKGVSELLKYSSSTQMQARGGMNLGRPQSRGMQGSVVANSRLNGLNIVSTTAFRVEMLERLDVLNSLTGALYGPASPAGQFNFVSKRPSEENLRRFSLSYQGRNAYTGHVDLGGYFDSQKHFGYRVNVLSEEGEGVVDDSTLRHRLFSGAFDWNIQPGTQLQVDASRFEFVQKGYPGGFSYSPDIDLPSAPDPQDKNLSLHTAGSDLMTETVSARLIHHLNDNWLLTAGLGWQQADRAMRLASNTIVNNSGDISRSMSSSSAAGRFRVQSNSLILNGHIDTGTIGHDLSLSTTGYLWTRYNASGASERYDLGMTNMYHPEAMTEPADGGIKVNGSRYKSGESTQQSITVGDIATFNEQWSAMFYLSQSWLRAESFNRQGHKTGKESQNGLSSSVALMYKLTPALMAYGSYADSLEEGGTAPIDVGVINEGETLDPYRSQQYELGLKAELDAINVSATVFRLERPFAYVDADDMVYKEQGNQLNNGLELLASGRIWQGLNIYSGATFLDPRLRDTIKESTSDKRVIAVPKVRANVLFEYSLLSMPQWVYSANLHYTGKRAANDTNTATADSFTTLDLGLRYSTRINDVTTTFRFEVNNVTDEHYWASIFPTSTDGDGSSPRAFLGSGREVRAALSFDL
ncbi:MAG: TonB-dependent siderophore receptor [Parahaliea sp.]